MTIVNKHDTLSYPLPTNVNLIKDLGIIDGVRKGIYECNICKTQTVQITSNAKKGKGRCKDCGKLSELKDMPSNFICGLGMQYVNETSSRKTRLCIAECSVCQEHYTTSARDLKNGKSNMCRSCSLKFSGWSDSEWELRGKQSSNFDNYKVYIVKIYNEKETFFKIGKTYITVKERFSREASGFLYEYDVVAEIISNSGIEISKIERELHSLYRENSYTPNYLFNGHTECFTEIDFVKVKECLNNYKGAYYDNY